MSNTSLYRACIVGLTGIAAGDPPKDGAGGIGQIMPSSHAPAYAHLPQTEVVGVCDLRQELVDQFLTNWSGIFPGVKGYADYRDMLEECRPDLLSVVTSDHRHADIVVYAAESGVQGMYCEKPIATTLADADRMIEAIDRRHVVMSINHTRRWTPIYRQIREEIENGTIGALKRIAVNMGGPRAILFRNGTHMIDMVCFLADSDPVWVFAELDEGYEDYWPYQGDGGRNADLEPGCSGYIHFENGIRAYYNGSKGLAPRTGFELTGTDGWIFIDEQGADVGVAGSVKRIYTRPVTHSHAAAAIREIIQAIEQGGQTISPPREARKTLEVILGFLASQKHGNTRIDFPLDECAI